ncbi:cysteine desulfurase family protein [Sporosarcina sp. CAU 1771]
MIYLDNSATTTPNEEVLTSFVKANQRFFANPASLHRAGKEAELLLERSREQILSILGEIEGEVIFTSGGTEANNLAVIGLARKLQSKGKHVITTAIEHPSVLYSFKRLETEGFEVDYLSVDKDGLISLDELKAKLRESTILVSIMHVNNEIGSVQLIDECAGIIRSYSRAVFHTDAVQSFGKLPIGLASGGPDALTISGHKINGLKGTGILALRKDLLPESINYGGEQEGGIRSGTVSVPNAVSIAKAMRLSVLGNKVKQFSLWRNRLIDFLKTFEDILVLAEISGAPHILAIAFNGIKGEVAVNFFQENNIIVSTSSACSSKINDVGHVIKAIQLPENYRHGVIRISFGEINEEDDMIKFEKTLLQFMELLRRGKTNGME